MFLKNMQNNDYQHVLEKQWEEALRKKYPVVVDEKVLSAIVNKK